MGKDKRLFIPIALDFLENAKIRPLSDKAKVTLLDLLIWSAKSGADGKIPPKTFATFGNPKVRAELMGNHPERPSVYEDEGSYWLHDFTAHNRTVAEIATLSEARRKAGSEGGKSKANAKQVLEQNVSEIYPDNRGQITDTRTTYVGGDLTVGAPWFCEAHPKGSKESCVDCGNARRAYDAATKAEKLKPTPTPPRASDYCSEHDWLLRSQCTEMEHRR